MIGAIVGDIAGSRFELDGRNMEIPLVNRYCGVALVGRYDIILLLSA